MTALPARRTNDAAPDAPSRPDGGSRRDNGLRRCLVSGESRDKSLLLRFVVGPDNTIVPDVEGKLPGRGLWLTPRRDIVEAAVKKGVFAKAAKASVAAPDGLGDRIEALLVRRSVELLGLARRAGRAVAGFTQVEAALREGGVAALVEAAEGSPGGRSKLAGLAPGVPVAGLLTAAELGRAFARETVVHAALSRGKLVQSFLAEQARLAGFRQDVGTQREKE